MFNATYSSSIIKMTSLFLLNIVVLLDFKHVCPCILFNAPLLMDAISQVYHQLKFYSFKDIQLSVGIRYVYDVHYLESSYVLLLGETLYGNIMKPTTLQPGEKCPTILNVYGGPHIQVGYEFKFKPHVTTNALFSV